MSDQSKRQELAAQIIKGMQPWYAETKIGKLEVEDMRAKDSRSRTDQQRIWDHAILTAAEFVRRLDDGDESAALLIHGLLSSKLPKDEECK